MGAICVLDQHTADLIAAGEVVERPASAVKELLENAADAGATRIALEIKGGGVRLIRVTDNGCGIAREDVPTALLRHATSKIRGEQDLHALQTLGFRGEALAAIAAVSDLSIMTKRREDEMGTLLVSHAGEVSAVEDVGCPDGTTVLVENLFAGVPARRKFLKRDATEAAAVIAAAEKFALSRPNVALTVISDGSVKVETPGDGSLKNVIYTCVGRDFASNMIDVEHTWNDVRVFGFVGKPETCRPNRNFENFFVNGRYVKSKTMLAGLEEGFRSFCPAGKFPSAVLFLELLPDRIDVNIHPAKLEVKFTDEKTVFDTVYYAVKKALMGISAKTQPDAQTSRDAVDGGRGLAAGEHKREVQGNGTGAAFTDVFVPSEQTPLSEAKQAAYQGYLNSHFRNQGRPTVQAAKGSYSAPDADKQEKLSLYGFPSERKDDASGGKAPAPPPKNESPKLQNEIPPSLVQERPESAGTTLQTGADQQMEFLSEPTPDPKYLGEIFRQYLLVQYRSSLYLIDKHAAHERILYEELKAKAGDGGSQTLLEPIPVLMTTKELAAAEQYRDQIEESGFAFDVFGSDTCLIRAYPKPLGQETVAESFSILVGKLAESNRNTALAALDRALYTVACRSAIKAGESSHKESNEWLVKRVFSDDAVLYCPHGRPVIVEFSKTKLDKMFGRL